MKKYILILGVVLANMLFGQIETNSKTSYGLMFMGGGRYDDLRMCVGSAAGVKGGPIADIMFVTKYHKNANNTLSINIPVFRPILFGAAFKLLQFEPEVNWEIYRTTKSGKRIYMGPGLGLSLHYGPDYESDLDNRGEDFFAIGPMLNYSVGLSFNEERTKNIGLKLFYIPLFGEDKNNGTVLGAAVQYYIIF